MFRHTISQRKRCVGGSVVCTQHCHQRGVTVTRSCINTIYLSWWWARRARNMWEL